MCMHTLSPADMSHTVCCPAALTHGLGEIAEEAKSHPISQLACVVRFVRLLHNDCEAAGPSSVIW